jgi:hypothetical protein
MEMRVLPDSADVRDQAEAQRRLQELLSSLRHYQGELELAELNGFEFVAESARREIRKRHEMIQRHCGATGLPMPPEVARRSE